MRWTRTLQLVEAHCEGEVGRVVTAGVIGPPGRTMAAKLDHLNRTDDRLRRLLCSEPRGAPAGSCILIPPATRPEADAGFIVLQPDQAHAMSGSNAICAATVLLETGALPMTEPETVVTFDTAAGLVRATASCRDGKCERVALDMPTAFAEALDAPLTTEQWGEIRYDLCFGGVFYALVDVAQVGLRIEPAQARALAEAGMALLDLINAADPPRHPEIPEVSGVAYVMFRDRDPDGAIRTSTCMRPGRLDRSPCGTGTNAAVAALAARDAAAPGDALVSRSVTGGEFQAQLREITQIAGRPAVKVSISGRAWIYGMHQLGVDPTDPYPDGFTVSDVWGG